MGDALTYFAVLALVALASSRRGRIAFLALRWLGGHPLRARSDRSPQAHAARSARRAAGIAGSVAAWYGSAVAPEVTLPVLAVLGAGGAGYGAYRAREWKRRRSHHRRWVRPAFMAARDIAAWPEDQHPSKWLTVAPDRSVVTAKLPVGWKGEAGDQARLSQVLATRLGIESPVVRWQLAGHAPRLELAKSPPPPGRTTLADALAVLERAKDDELVWGPGKRGAWVVTSLSGDSPHVGLSMGSGGGKSETAKSIAVQQLHRGAIVLILDYKMTSHPWARGLPNVVTLVRIPEIHKALTWLGAEATRRKEVAYAGTDMHGQVHADVGPRLVIILEELNATVAMLRAYWRETGEKGRSPALAALDEVSFMGRSALMNLVYIGQRLSDKATGGGGDARENIGVIAFARYRASTWKMLAPDFPMPPKSLTPGRIQVVSDEVREAQGILWSTGEAREYALSGRVSALPYGMPGAGGRGPVQAGVQGGTPGTDLVISRPDLRIVQGEVVPEVAAGTPAVTLREAVDAGVLPMSLHAARKARTRRRFPEPVGRDGTAELYDLAALDRWARERKG